MTANGPLEIVAAACDARAGLLRLLEATRRERRELEMRVASVMLQIATLDEQIARGVRGLPRVLEDCADRLGNLAGRADTDRVQLLDAILQLEMCSDSITQEQADAVRAAAIALMSLPVGTPVVLRNHQLVDTPDWYGRPLIESPHLVYVRPSDLWFLRAPLLKRPGKNVRGESIVFSLLHLTDDVNDVQDRGGMYVGEDRIRVAVQAALADPATNRQSLRQALRDAGLNPAEFGLKA